MSNHSLKWLCQFTHPQDLGEGPQRSVSRLTLGIFSLLNFIQESREKLTSPQ